MVGARETTLECGSLPRDAGDLAGLLGIMAIRIGLGLGFITVMHISFAMETLCGKVTMGDKLGT